MICIDSDDMMIKGDYNSNNAQMLLITFNRCHDRQDCKSKEEIDDFIKGKYMVVMSNTVRFDSLLLAQNAIVRESVLTWYPVSYK